MNVLDIAFLPIFIVSPSMFVLFFMIYSHSNIKHWNFIVYYCVSVANVSIDPYAYAIMMYVIIFISKTEMPKLEESIKTGSGTFARAVDTACCKIKDMSMKVYEKILKKNLP